VQATSPWFLCVLTKVGEVLIWELETSFLTNGVMDALGIVYPQYWMQVECDASFAKYFYVIKRTFYYAKTHKVDEQNIS